MVIRGNYIVRSLEDARPSGLFRTTEPGFGPEAFKQDSVLLLREAVHYDAAGNVLGVRVLNNTPQERYALISRRVANESSYPYGGVNDSFPTMLWGGGAPESPAMDAYVRHAMNTGEMGQKNAILQELVTERNALREAYRAATPQYQPVIAAQGKPLTNRIDAIVDKQAPALLAQTRWGQHNPKEGYWTTQDWYIPKHEQLRQGMGQPGYGGINQYSLPNGTVIPLTEDSDAILEAIDYARRSPYGGTFEMQYGSNYTPSEYGRVQPTWRTDRHFTPMEVAARERELTERMTIGHREGAFGQDERMNEIDSSRPELDPRYASGIPWFEQDRYRPSQYLQPFGQEPDTITVYPQLRMDIPTGRPVQDAPVAVPYDPVWDAPVQGEGTPLSRLAMGAAPIPPEWGGLGERRFMLGMPANLIQPSNQLSGLTNLDRGEVVSIAAFPDRRANTLDPRVAAIAFTGAGSNPGIPSYGMREALATANNPQFVGTNPALVSPVLPLPALSSGNPRPVPFTERLRRDERLMSGTVPLEYVREVWEQPTPETLAFNRPLELVPDPRLLGLRPNEHLGFERWNPLKYKKTGIGWESIPIEEIPSRYIKPPDNYWYQDGMVMQNIFDRENLGEMYTQPLDPVARSWSEEFQNARQAYNNSLGDTRTAVNLSNQIADDINASWSGIVSRRGIEELIEQDPAINRLLDVQMQRDLQTDGTLDMLDHVIVAQRGMTGREDPSLGLYQWRARNMGVADQGFDQKISLTDGLVRTPEGYVRTDITMPQGGDRDYGRLEPVAPTVDPNQGMLAVAAQAKLNLLNKQRAVLGLPPYDPRTNNPVEIEMGIQKVREATLKNRPSVPGEEQLQAKVARRQNELDRQRMDQIMMEGRATSQRQTEWRKAGERLGYQGNEALNVGRYLSTQKVGRVSLDKVDPRIAQAHLASLPPEAIARIGRMTIM